MSSVSLNKTIPPHSLSVVHGLFLVCNWPVPVKPDTNIEMLHVLVCCVETSWAVFSTRSWRWMYWTVGMPSTYSYWVGLTSVSRSPSCTAGVSRNSTSVSSWTQIRWYVYTLRNDRAVVQWYKHPPGVQFVWTSFAISEMSILSH